MALLITGVVIKNYLFNTALNRYAGDDAIAVVNVLAISNNMITIFSTGVCSAFVSLAGIYSGEDDRESFIDLMRNCLVFGLIGCILITAATMAFSHPLAGLFFDTGEFAEKLAQRMFLLNPLFLPFNGVLYLLLRSYQAQGKLTMANILSFLEPTAVGVVSIITVPRMGTDAAWLSNTWVDIACLLLVLCYAFWVARRISLSIPLLLRLSDDFGAPEGTYVEYSIHNLQEAIAISQNVVDFCRQRGIEKRKAFYAGLCTEEIAVNIITHGFKPKGRNSADFRIVYRDKLVMRFRDDCREFDPKQRMDTVIFDPASPEKNIGIRVVARLASDISYYNDAGINTLITAIDL